MRGRFKSADTQSEKKPKEEKEKISWSQINHRILHDDYVGKEFFFYTTAHCVCVCVRPLHYRYNKTLLPPRN